MQHSQQNVLTIVRKIFNMLILNKYKFDTLIIKWTSLFIFSLLVLLWLSPDSYLMHDYGTRYDSSWFFTAGKAWMEGMTPYIDFADSKGPILWLIYGIGYLISPTSYHGVFWLTIVAYTIAFNFLWRTSRLFLSKRESLFVIASIPFFLFFIAYHNEVRAEDFCMSGICGGIYYACNSLKHNRQHIGGGQR